MENIVIGAIIIILLIVAILTYCGMVVAGRDDERMREMMAKAKKKGKE